MSGIKGLYDEGVERAAPVEESEQKSLYKEIDYAFDVDDGVIYLVGEIGDYALFDIMTRTRTILKNRKKGDKSPINLVINSQGGDLYEMMGIIDYIKSLGVKVNTICRGK